jgi:hypothetical protein
LSVNAPQLRIGVIRKGLILQVSFTRKACEAYSATRGQFEHISMIILCVDFTVGKNLRSLCFQNFIHIQYEIKALYCGVEEGEMSNLAAQRHYRIDETNFRQWKKQKEQLCMTWSMLLCGRTVIKNSDDDLGHPRA